MIGAREAIVRLKEGNRRFVQSLADGEVAQGLRTIALALEQNPSAIILGCSDARVPAEIVFDQGPGELFVIRVAGNIVSPSQVGSVEFAAERFGTRLVVVLGHTRCGAIQATIEDLTQGDAGHSRHLLSIVDRIRPSVAPLLQTGLVNDLERLSRLAVRANVAVSVNHLRHGSEVLERLIRTEDLLVVGAEYAIETGVVEFLDGV